MIGEKEKEIAYIGKVSVWHECGGEISILILIIMLLLEDKKNGNRKIVRSGVWRAAMM